MGTRVYKFILIFLLLIAVVKTAVSLPIIDFNKNSIIQLNNHDWEFYYGSSYQDINHQTKPNSIQINVPGNWADHAFPNTGYGTYVFKFLPKIPVASHLMLKMYTVACSHNLYVNGHLIRKIGNYHVDADKAKPDFYPYLVGFDAEKDTIEIAIEVANFNYRNGGLWFTPIIGLSEPMETLDKRNTAVEAFLIGSLFLLFSFFITFYYTKTEDKTSLYFALMCLFAALRIGSTGEVLLRQLELGIPWELIVKIEYISLTMVMVFGLLYLRCLFPRDFNPKVFSSLQLIQIFSAFCFLSLPVYYASFIIPYYLLYCIFLLAYIINLVVKVNLVKRPFSLQVGIACLLVVFTGVNDILHSQGLIKTFYAMPLGILIYAIIQAMVITKMFNISFEKVEQLSNELKDTNKNQLAIIEERTSELNKYAIDLKQSNQIKDKVFSIIAHDLRAPIKSLSTVLVWVSEDDLTFEELKKSLSNISKNVDTLNLTLENLLQWSRSQLNGVKSEPELIDIRKPIQEMMDLFKIQLGEKKLTLKYNHSHRYAVYIDKHHLNLLFRNLLSNAIKYSNEGGEIEIKATHFNTEFTIIEFIDSGIGMSQDAMSKVFSATDHYSTYGTKNERGTGLGLLLCKEYVDNSGGKIWIESKEGEGAKISIVLPNTRM